MVVSGAWNVAVESEEEVVVKDVLAVMEVQLALESVVGDRSRESTVRSSMESVSVMSARTSEARRYRMSALVLGITVRDSGIEKERLELLSCCPTHSRPEEEMLVD